jgi:hypothetical protein
MHCFKKISATALILLLCNVSKLPAHSRDNHGEGSFIAQAQPKDVLQNIRFATQSIFIVMPVVDRSSSSVSVGGVAASVSDDYATETLNARIREAGATTISWFKVNSSMNKKLGQTGVQRVDLTSDLFVPELIEVAKPLGAKYIIRPTIINKSSSTSTEVQVGFFANTVIKTDTTIVTLKVDIISVPVQDIIATSTFDGAVKEQIKSNPFSTAPIVTVNSTGGVFRSATNDAVTKAVDFIASKVQ